MNCFGPKKVLFCKKSKNRKNWLKKEQFDTQFFSNYICLGYWPMRPFSQQQIKQLQLDLLVEEGVSLLQFQVGQRTHFSPHKDTQFLSQSDLHKINIQNITKLKRSNHSHLETFVCLILKAIFKKQVKEDLLHILKTSIFNCRLDQPQFEGQYLKILSDWNQKKILVEFLYELVYSSDKNKVQRHLNKFPIILNSLVSVFRFILLQLTSRDTKISQKSLSNSQIYQILIGFFDLSFKKNGNVYLFYEENLFIAQSDPKYIYIGDFSLRISQETNQSTKKNENQRSIEIDLDNGVRSPQRFSFVYQVQPITPSFKTKQNRHLIQKKVAAEQLINGLKTKQKQDHKPDLAKKSTRKQQASSKMIKSKTQRLEKSNPLQTTSQIKSNVCVCSKQTQSYLSKTKTCICKIKTRSKIRLRSNIYDIKIWFQRPKSPQKQIYSQQLLKSQLYVCCQGVNSETFDSAATSFSDFSKNSKNVPFNISRQQSIENVYSNYDIYSPRQQRSSTYFRVSIDGMEKYKQPLSFRKPKLKPELLKAILRQKRNKKKDGF